jgi:hypothetical protein
MVVLLIGITFLAVTLEQKFVAPYLNKPKKITHYVYVDGQVFH